MTNPQQQSNKEVITILQDLENQINQEIINFGGEAFVKLESRSAKDYIYQSKELPLHIKENFIKQMNLLAGTENKIPNEAIITNMGVVSKLRSCQQALAVQSGLDAMKLLFASSNRITRDLEKSLNFGSNSEFPIHLLVRKFEIIDPKLEFRTFISNKEITAISQYFHFCFFEELDQQLQMERRIALIKEFYEENVKPFLPVMNCIADFAFMNNETQIQLIELNPFHVTTEGCLFDWGNEKDLKLINEGPLCYRFRECISQQQANLYLGESFRVEIEKWKKSKIQNDQEKNYCIEEQQFRNN